MLDEYLIKESGQALSNFFKDIGIGFGLGGIASAESGAAFRKEKNLWLHGPTEMALLRIPSDDNVRRDFVLGGTLSTVFASSGRAKGGTGGAIGGGLTGAAIDVPLTNYVVAAAEANNLTAEANKLKQLELELLRNINDIRTAAIGILGMGALGLGGYALYKYLSNKKEEKAAPPKVKVRIKGNSRDPYDDATVEVPLHNLRVTENLERGVNRSMRRVIRDNNIFSSKKKDPFTGKLISYEEYISKYGDPKLKNKKETFSDGSIPFTSNSVPLMDAKPTVDKETDYIDPIMAYDLNNESI